MILMRKPIQKRSSGTRRRRWCNIKIPHGKERDSEDEVDKTAPGSSPVADFVTMVPERLGSDS
jgi:hypothetical protein